MNGDLGNLLTGELGEAEARFAHEDFAGDFGRSVAGRVRRRRTVRAAGVGGGTMLTAGALAIGATSIPWGTLGEATVGGIGETGSATPALSQSASQGPSPSTGPSSTHTPAPGVADSPFQCGFEFPTPTSEPDELGITAREVSGDEIRAEFDRRFGNQSPTTDVGTGDGVWAIVTGMPGGQGGTIPGETSVLDPHDPDRTYVAGRPWASEFIAEGVSFVGVSNGVVAAIIVPADTGVTPGFIDDREAQGSDLDAFLVDRAALTLCDTTGEGLDQLTLYVVAGYVTQLGDTTTGPTYAWREVGGP